MASPIRWAWVWVNSGSWWRTGRPGVLWFTGRKELDMTEQLNWTEGYRRTEQYHQPVGSKQHLQNTPLNTAEFISLTARGTFTRTALWPVIKSNFNKFKFYKECSLTTCVCSVAQLCLTVTPWTAARQTPLFMRILQARFSRAAMPSSRGSSQPRNQTQVHSIAGGFFTVWATREAHSDHDGLKLEINCRRTTGNTWKLTNFY